MHVVRFGLKDLARPAVPSNVTTSEDVATYTVHVRIAQSADYVMTLKVK